MSSVAETTVPPNTNKKAPAPLSEAYSRARGMLLFRLSESLFGSLLAAYIIGSVSLTRGIKAPTIDGYTPGWISAYPEAFRCLPFLQVAVICLSFAFATTGIYLGYHTTILPMPTYRMEKMHREFLFAAFQAIFFGIAIYLPFLLFPLVGLLALWCLGARRGENARLVDELVRKGLHPRYKEKVVKENPYLGKAEGDCDPPLRKVVRSALRKYRFSYWAGIGLWPAGLLTWLLGFSVIAYAVALPVLWHFYGCPSNGGWHWLISSVIMDVLVAIVIFVYVRRIIAGAGGFLEEMDSPKENGLNENYNKMTTALSQGKYEPGKD